MKEALVLIGHGSRLPYSKELIAGIADEIAKKDKYPIVTYGMMEFNDPSIKDTIKKVVEQGAEKIIVVPVFLANGNHTERDIPQILRKEPTEAAKEAMKKKCGSDECQGHEHEHGHGHGHHHHHDHKSDIIDELPEGVEIIYRDVIGLDPRLVDIVMDRAEGR